MVYLHILSWDGPELRLPSLNERIIRGEALTGGTVRITQTADATIIRLPVRNQSKVDTVVKLEVENTVPLQ
jgi:hypothetical protein